MKAPKARRKDPPSAAKIIPFSSRLKPYLNQLLHKRYVDKEPVSAVLGWLEGQGCQISPRSYHECLTRVLVRLPLAQAQTLGVEVALLRAIRVRLQLPTESRRTGSPAKRVVPRHDSRHRRRPLALATKPKPAVTKVRAASTPEREPSVLPEAKGSAGSEPSQEEREAVRKLTREEFIALHKGAKKKIRALNRNMATNLRGCCRDLATLDEYYHAEELQSAFGLTYAEAWSCFQPTDPGTGAMM